MYGVTFPLLRKSLLYGVEANCQIFILKLFLV